MSFFDAVDNQIFNIPIFGITNNRIFNSLSISSKYNNSKKVTNIILYTSIILAIFLAIIYKLFGIKYLFNPLSPLSTRQSADWFIKETFYFSALTNGTIASIILVGITITLLVIRRYLKIDTTHHTYKILGLSLKTWGASFAIFLAILPFIGNQLFSRFISEGSLYVNNFNLISLGVVLLYPSFLMVYNYKDLIKFLFLGFIIYLILPALWIFYIIPQTISIIYKRLTEFLTSGRYVKLKITIVATIAAIIISLAIVYLLSLIDPVFAKYFNDLLNLTIQLMREYLELIFILLYNFSVIFSLLFGYISLLPEIPLLISHKRFQKPLTEYKYHKHRSKEISFASFTPILLILIIPILVLFIFNMTHTYHLLTLKDLELLNRYEIINYPQFAIKGVKSLILVIGIIVGILSILYNLIAELIHKSPKLIKSMLGFSVVNIIWTSIITIYKIGFAINYSGPTVRRLAAFLVIFVFSIGIIIITGSIYSILKQRRHSIFSIAIINDITLHLIVLGIILNQILLIFPINDLTISLITRRIINKNESHGFIYLFNSNDSAFNPELVDAYKDFYTNFPNSIKTTLLFEYIQSQQKYLTYLLNEQINKGSATRGSLIQRLLVTDAYSTVFYYKAKNILQPKIRLTEYLNNLGILPEGVQFNSCIYTPPQEYTETYHPRPFTEVINKPEFYTMLDGKEYLICTFVDNDSHSYVKPVTYDVYFIDQKGSPNLKIFVVLNSSTGTVSQFQYTAE